jgi:hypothetical protein
MRAEHVVMALAGLSLAVLAIEVVYNALSGLRGLLE